jgi:AraC-like DNA-binding protein
LPATEEQVTVAAEMSVARSLLCTYEEVDSDAFPVAERFAQWCETARLPMAVEPAGESGRDAFRICLRKLSDLSGRFSDITASPMTFRRTSGHCAADGLDMISLTVMLGANVQHEFTAAGRSATVRPRSILVKDFARPATAAWKSAGRSLNLHLPRLTVEAAVGDKVKQLHGTVLSGGLTPMLHAQLRALANLAAGFKGAVLAAALDATVDLAVTVLRCELGRRSEDEANDAGLFAAALVYIRQQLGNPRLTPELITRQLNCSRAHLYRAFAGQGETVANYIREQRLRQARALLAGAPDARIGDIAYRCGIEDPVLFARLFRRRFGLSPSALKAGRGRQGTEMALPPSLGGYA